jgi:hypothetical protein
LKSRFNPENMRKRTALALNPDTFERSASHSSSLPLELLVIALIALLVLLIAAPLLKDLQQTPTVELRRSQ